MHMGDGHSNQAENGTFQRYMHTEYTMCCVFPFEASDGGKLHKEKIIIHFVVGLCPDKILCVLVLCVVSIVHLKLGSNTGQRRSIEKFNFQFFRNSKTVDDEYGPFVVISPADGRKCECVYFAAIKVNLFTYLSTHFTHFTVANRQRKCVGNGNYNQKHGDKFNLRRALKLQCKTTNSFNVFRSLSTSFEARGNWRIGDDEREREFNGLTLKVKTENHKRQRNDEMRDRDKGRGEEERERGRPKTNSTK